MDGTQSWWTSKTIWASLFAILVPIVGTVLHINLTDADVQELAGYAVAIASVIAGLCALYGRITATKTIGKPPAPTVTPPTN